MSKAVAGTEGFLPYEYDAALEPYRGLIRETEFPLDPDITISENLTFQLGKLRPTATTLGPFIMRQNSDVPSSLDTAADVQRYFQIRALSNIATDLASKAALSLTTGFTAMAEVYEEDPGIAERGHEIGEKIINTRSLFDADVLLDAHFYWTRLHGDQETDSVLDRAVKARNRAGNLRRPFESFEEGELEAFAEIVDRFSKAPMPIKDYGDFEPSRSRIVTKFRVGRHGRRMVRRTQDLSESASALEALDEVTTMMARMTPPVIELEPPELMSSMRTAVKLRRFVASAAVVDPSLRTDPKVVYTELMAKELDGYDAKSSQAVFERDVKKIVKRERKNQPKNT